MCEDEDRMSCFVDRIISLGYKNGLSNNLIKRKSFKLKINLPYADYFLNKLSKYLCIYVCGLSILK